MGTDEGPVEGPIGGTTGTLPDEDTELKELRIDEEPVQVGQGVLLGRPLLGVLLGEESTEDEPVQVGQGVLLMLFMEELTDEAIEELPVLPEVSEIETGELLTDEEDTTDELPDDLLEELPEGVLMKDEPTEDWLTKEWLAEDEEPIEEMAELAELAEVEMTEPTGEELTDMTVETADDEISLLQGSSEELADELITDELP